jgi:hypothetical protein
MTQKSRWAPFLAVALLVGPAITAQAQYGYYPRGYGGYGWGGWGGGAQTPGGDLARGMGVYAAGAGVYNQQTAVARSINTDTVMRYNQYMYESDMEANRKYHARKAAQESATIQDYDAFQRKLRDHPDQHDIEMGDALNVAVEEIENPRIYGRTLELADVKIGGELIRDIPFRYAAAGITVSIHRLTKGTPPAALMTADFEEDRGAFRELGAKLRKELEDGDKPDSETVNKALKVINAAEAKADKILPRNTSDRNEVDRYLKALHGLIAMLDTPALDLITAGVEKHPDATLAQLLGFMKAYNLRFGQAKTPRQREIYGQLYPQLANLRDQVGPALATAAPIKTNGSEPGEFFSGMDYQDLQKKAPPPR